MFLMAETDDIVEACVLFELWLVKRACCGFWYENVLIKKFELMLRDMRSL